MGLAPWSTWPPSLAKLSSDKTMACTFITGSAGDISNGLACFWTGLENGFKFELKLGPGFRLLLLLLLVLLLLPRQIISVINDSLRWQLEAKWRHRQMDMVAT